MYIFTTNNEILELLHGNTSCGSVCVNDIMMQFSGFLCFLLFVSSYVRLTRLSLIVERLS